MNSRARLLWLIVGWLLVLLVIILSLVPVPVDVPVEEGDKIGHVVAYAALMFWFANLFETLNRRSMLAIGFVVLGIALEFAQGWTDYRTFELADMAADAFGVAVGWVLAPPRLPNFLRGIEKFPSPWPSPRKRGEGTFAGDSERPRNAETEAVVAEGRGVADAEPGGRAVRTDE